MEYSFFRSSGGSFLVFQEESLSEGYVRKMLSSSPVSALLEERILHLGGKVELHYRISGMQTLERRFESKRMRTKEITALLDQIVRLREECAARLLPDRHLFLEPSLIYAMYLEKEYHFLYLPEEETTFSAQMRLLADFLMKHVSYEDGEDAGVKIVYALQEAACTDGFDLTVWWRVNRPQQEWQQEERQAQVWEPVQLPEMVSCSGNGEPAWEEESSDRTHVEEGLFGFPGCRSRRQKKTPGGRTKKRRVPSGSRKRRKKATADGLLRHAGGSAGPVCVEWDVPCPSSGQAAEQDTVCLSDSAQALSAGSIERRHVLAPTDGSDEIVLEKPFLLIGTAAQKVDIVLQDRTVSRVHAEIFCDEAGVRIGDCNSCNGTLVDGEMLLPNELKTLKTGMHIRMGLTEFVFR